MSNDTIVAISTPTGKAGIGIVRLSGPRAVAIADKIFMPKSAGKPSDFKSHAIHYGWIVSNCKPQAASHSLQLAACSLQPDIVDEVLLTVMRSPRTYTKQDIVEINCHSGIVVLRKILDLAIKNGGRLAEPGEFTKRAFLNGRIDLSQAEAVLDVINSQTEASLKAAVGQLRGGLSKKVSLIRDELLDLLAQLEASIDFSHEDIQIVTGDVFVKRLTDAESRIDKLLKNIEAGIILRDGINAVIIGKPNVGKSSLMNALLERERVIVTPIPGTTRDSVEETVDMKGIPVKLIDTAGIRESKGLIDRMTAQKTGEYLDTAKLVLFVVDASQALTREDFLAAGKLKDKQCIAVINKIDLKQNIDPDALGDFLPAGARTIRISAIQNTDIDLLKSCICELVWGGSIADPADIVVTNARHKAALTEARHGLKRAKEAFGAGLSAEFVAVDIKDAVNSLGKITGQTLEGEVLDRIFQQFCIGK